MFHKNPKILTNYSNKKAPAPRQKKENEAENDIKVCTENN